MSNDEALSKLPPEQRSAIEKYLQAIEGVSALEVEAGELSRQATQINRQARLLETTAANMQKSAVSELRQAFGGEAQ